MVRWLYMYVLSELQAVENPWISKNGFLKAEVLLVEDWFRARAAAWRKQFPVQVDSLHQ